MYNHICERVKDDNYRETLEDADIDQIMCRAKDRPVHFFIYSVLNANKDKVRQKILKAFEKRKTDIVIKDHSG